MELQKKIHAEKLTGSQNVPRHLLPNDKVISEWPVPQFGEHGLIPPANKTPEIHE
jgi:hypothetical protein